MTARKVVAVKQKVLSENDRLAGENRRSLVGRGILTLNLVSSPGSGKTSLLEKTLHMLATSMRIGVIAGDVQTENDARRLEAAGGQVVRPIVTGGACHLDANMIADTLARMDLTALDVLFIENVGNLVCPSCYDLGEDMKIVLMSVPEGDDKPLKYPAMFRRSSVLVINKTDLLGTSDFRIDVAAENALRINGELTVLKLSCRAGDGLDGWYNWLKTAVADKRTRCKGGTVA